MTGMRDTHGMIIYRIIDTLIGSVSTDDHSFTIPFTKVSELGIDIEAHTTLANKFRRFRDRDTSPLDNQRKTLKKMKLTEHVHFSLSRVETSRNRYEPLAYYITRNTYLLIVSRRLNKQIIPDVSMYLAKIIAYYNKYRDRMTISRLSTLKQSIIDVSSEVNKLATIAEELSGSRESLPKSDIYQDSDSDSDNGIMSESRDRTLANTQISRNTDTSDTKKIQLDRSTRGRSITELVVRPSNKDLIMDCIGLHKIHSKFKRVATHIGPLNRNIHASGLYNERLSTINDELFNINKQIDSIINSIEFSESM
jgi:hypothetical protein